jgi:hypothetical protein
MSTPTRRAARTLAALAVLLTLTPVPAARAQDVSASLRLLQQTPWGTQYSVKGRPPVTRIDISVAATNTGATPIEDPVVVLVLGPVVTTRGEYDQQMVPQVPLLSISTVPHVQEGTIEPSQTRTFDVSLDLAALTDAGVVSTTVSGIYPLAIELRNADTPLTELRTPVLYYVRAPEQPIAFAWTVELSPPVGFAPSGELASADTEVAIAPGGRIAAQLSSLSLLAANGTPVNLALSPILLDTLRRMAAGYRVGDRVVPRGQGGAANAASVLGTLGRIVAAPTVQTSLYPFAAPQLPAVLNSGLGRDLDRQVAAGKELAATAIDLEPQTRVARAPFGALDGGAVGQLAHEGATVLLADADTVERPLVPPQDFAPPPTAALDRPGGGDPLALVLPDPGAQAVLTSELATTDPVLAAQRTLGSLAAVWQEAPLDPRGVAVSLTDDLALPPGFWDPIARRIANAPFLDPVSASELVDRVPPGDPVDLAAPSTAVFTDGYAEEVKQERRRVDALTSMLDGPSDLPARLERALLYAEAGQYVGPGEASGRAWTGAVHAQTDLQFARTVPDPSPGYTLTYRAATIPLLIPGSPGPPLDVEIELQSPQLRFPEGATQKVRITDEQQSVPFRVEATGAGQIPLTVIVHAPNGRELNKRTVAIRSTAYNRIALVITGAAALALVALWVRRLVARRRTT